MRRAIRVLLAAAALATGLTAGEPEEPLWSHSSEISLVSQYLWRGFVLNDSPSLQPAVTIGYRGFSVSSFASFSKCVPRGSGPFTEHDLEVDYTREIGAFTWSVGYANYFQASSEESPWSLTHEIYAGVSHSGVLESSFRVSRDVAEGDGMYWYASIGRSFALRQRIAVEPTLGVGVNQHLYQPNTTVSNVDLGIKADLKINSRLTASPSFIQMIGHRTLFGSHRAFGITLAFER